MIDYLELPVGPNPPEVVHAVIEVPFGGVNKYEYDTRLKVFRLDRSLHSPVHFPGDYGFIPQTKSVDGEALDILVLVDNPSFCSCLVEARPIGVFEMMDHGRTDHKIIAVEDKNPRYADIRQLADVYPHIAREIEHFFSVYKALEMTETKVVGWADRDKARTIISDSIRRYHETSQLDMEETHR
jgi:inorganic pyrophosphatase